MKVIILCGGQGTRLREETEYKPKPMVEIGGRPILWHIMQIYARHGFTEFVLALGYKGHVIKEYFLNYQFMDNDFTVHLGDGAVTTHRDGGQQNLTVTLADTGLETLTAERIWRVRRYVEGETFMVTYGDGLADVDLQALLRFHRQQGRLATLTGVRDLARFGVVQTDGDNRVSGFKEKPQVQDWINAGFFVFEPGIFGYLKDQRCMLEQGPLPALAADSQLAIFRHEGFWQCMDTYRDYLKLTELWDSARAPWAVWRAL